MALKWTGKYRDQRAGEWRTFWSSGAWTLQRDGKRVSRHDSRESAMRKAGWNAAMRKAKRHRHVFIPTTVTGNATNVDDPAWIKMECDCRSIKMLGPSNDAPAEVQVEIRAAEIASTRGDGRCPSSTDEITGGIDYHTGADRWDDEDWRGWHAGWLAAEIRNWCEADDAWPWDITRPVAGQYEEWKREADADDSCMASIITATNREAELIIAEQTRHDVAASVARHADLPGRVPDVEDQIELPMVNAPVLPPLTPEEERAEDDMDSADFALAAGFEDHLVDAEILEKCGLVRFDVETEEDLGGEV